MVSSEDEGDTNSNDSLEWDVNLEIQLFYAMANNKPVGINKHFHMARIYEKLRNSTTKRITTADIWKHLGTLYDLQMLEETEPIPFPNDPVPFSLPESEYGELMRKKKSGITLTVDEEAGPSTSKDVLSSLPAKTRKESGSSYASTDTQSIKSEMDYDRRDSQDSNTSGTRDSSTSKKSTTYKEHLAKSKVTPATPSEALIEEDGVSRRGRRRPNNSTPPATSAKRRRI
ncbi:hypothetical protein ACJJTC_008975 [Scirpophaga incertulas]